MIGQKPESQVQAYLSAQLASGQGIQNGVVGDRTRWFTILGAPQVKSEAGLINGGYGETEEATPDH